MDGFTVREATAADGTFIADMLVEAANWRPGAVRSRAEVLAGDHRVYIAGWRRPGDRGLVAVSPRGDAVGAAWYRMLTRDAPGYGFVASGVPELVIGVRPVWRSRGVGRMLLAALIDAARAEGYARLALSVEHGNVARTLYRDEGFRIVATDGLRDTMVRRLR